MLSSSPLSRLDGVAHPPLSLDSHSLQHDRVVDEIIANDQGDRTKPSYVAFIDSPIRSVCRCSQSPQTRLP
jgi:hypothetical protein